MKRIKVYALLVTWMMNFPENPNLTARRLNYHELQAAKWNVKKEKWILSTIWEVMDQQAKLDEWTGSYNLISDKMNIFIGLDINQQAQSKGTGENSPLIIGRRFCPPVILSKFVLEGVWYPEPGVCLTNRHMMRPRFRVALFFLVLERAYTLWYLGYGIMSMAARSICIMNCCTFAALLVHVGSRQAANSWNLNFCIPISCSTNWQMASWSLTVRGMKPLYFKGYSSL